MFSRLQHALKTSGGKRMILMPQVHDELNPCQNFITSLDSSPTHLREIRPHPQTWKEVTDTSLTGMGGLFQSPSGQWFVWRIPVASNTSNRLLTEDKSQGELIINDTELAAYVAPLDIFAPLMKPLEHIETKVDNTSA